MAEKSKKYGPDKKLIHHGYTTSNEVMIYFSPKGPVLSNRRSLSANAVAFRECETKGLVFPTWRLAGPDKESNSVDTLVATHDRHVDDIIQTIQSSGGQSTIYQRAAKHYLPILSKDPDTLISFLQNSAKRNSTNVDLQKFAAKWTKILARDARVADISTSEYNAHAAKCIDDLYDQFTKKIGGFVRADLKPVQYAEYRKALKQAAVTVLKQTTVPLLKEIALDYDSNAVFSNVLAFVEPPANAHPEPELCELVLDEQATRNALRAYYGKEALSPILQNLRNLERQSTSENKELLASTLCYNSLKKPLSQGEAGQIVNDYLQRINIDSLSGKLIDLALSDPHLAMVVIPDVEVTNYYSDMGREKPKGLIYGFFDPCKNEIYIIPNRLSGAIEELLHAGFHQLYSADAKTYNQLPLPNAKEKKLPTDTQNETPRQQLFNEALRSDLNRLGGNADLLRQDLNLPEPGYSRRSFHAEILVKMLKMKATHQWKPYLSDRYKHLEHYLNTIVAGDIAKRETNRPNIRWDVSQLPPIDMAEYRRTMPLVPTRQPIERVDTGITLEAVQGSIAYVIHMDKFKIYNSMAAQKFMSELVIAPENVSQAIKVKDDVYTIPMALVKDEDTSHHFETIQTICNEVGLLLPRPLRASEKWADRASRIQERAATSADFFGASLH